MPWLREIARGLRRRHSGRTSRRLGVPACRRCRQGTRSCAIRPCASRRAFLQCDFAFRPRAHWPFLFSLGRANPDRAGARPTDAKAGAFAYDADTFCLPVLPFCESHDIVRLRFHFTSYALPEVVRYRWVFRDCDMYPCSTTSHSYRTGSDAVHCGSDSSRSTARQGGSQGETGPEFSDKPNRTSEPAGGDRASG